MPTLGNALDFAKYEGKNLRAHQLGAAPSSPVTGQLYYNTADNTLYWYDGMTWQTAKGGTAPDATASTKGLVQLAGDLAGSAASPQIAAGVIVDADVNGSAAIAESKLNLASDAAAGTPSRRTLGLTGNKAMPGTASLDQISPPAGDVSFNNVYLTNLRNPPQNTNDAATKAYVDGFGGGAWKQPVKVASTATLPLSGTANVDGITVVAGDRVLANGQASAATNGIYVVAAGAWSRATDADTWAKLVGAVVIGQQGGSWPDVVWVCTADQGGTLGTTSVNWRALPAGLGVGPGQGIMAIPGDTTLDMIPLAAATVNLNSKKISNLADPVAATDGANKQYVDNTVQGLDAKASVRVATTGNIALSAAPNCDGINPAPGDRVLVKDQTSTSENGIYVAAGGAWTRATDFNVIGETASAYVWVENGATQADTGWVCTNDGSGVLGSTAITWVQFSGAAQITAGAGLTKTGNTIDAVAGQGIQVNADSIQVANNGITNAMMADGAVDVGTADVTGTLPVLNGGTGAANITLARSNLSAAGYFSTATHGAGTSIVITQGTHSLRNSRGLIVQVQDATTGAVELPDIAVSATGDVTVTFGASVSANSKRVTIIG